MSATWRERFSSDSVNLPRCTAEALPDVHLYDVQCNYNARGLSPVMKQPLHQLILTVIASLFDTGNEITCTISCGLVCRETCKLSFNLHPASEHCCIIVFRSAPRDSKRLALFMSLKN